MAGFNDTQNGEISRMLDMRVGPVEAAIMDIRQGIAELKAATSDVAANVERESQAFARQSTATMAEMDKKSNSLGARMQQFAVDGHKLEQIVKDGQAAVGASQEALRRTQEEHTTSQTNMTQIVQGEFAKFEMKCSERMTAMESFVTATRA